MPLPARRRLPLPTCPSARPFLAAGLLAVAAGCAAPTDPWQEARTTCGLAEGETFAPIATIPDPDDGTLNGLVVSSECGELLVSHIGGNADSVLRLLSADRDLGAHFESVRTGDSPIDGLTVAVWGMLWLAGGDYGTVGSLQEGPYIVPAWIDRIDEEAADLELDDDAPLAQVLYDTAAARIKGVALLPTGAPACASMAVRGWPSDTLHVPILLDPGLGWEVEPWRPDISAAGLFHEAHHAGLDGLHHIDCAAPATGEGHNCDTDAEGAYGAGFLVSWSGAIAAYGGDICLPAPSLAVSESASFAETDIRGQWEESIMSAEPDSPFLGCE